MSGKVNLYKSNELPLIYRVAKENLFGNRMIFKSSAITDALFVYLEGEPEAESIEKLKSFTRCPLVCLSLEWQDFLTQNFLSIVTLQRFCMKEKKVFDFNKKITLPEGFCLLPFTKEIFLQHPFDHGKNYSSFEEFQKNGSGAVIMYDKKIVSSASSFLSYKGEVELDVSTDPNFRKMGFATACVSSMLKDCQNKGLIVHWDAQNPESKHLAECFGFELQNTYKVYII